MHVGPPAPGSGPLAERFELRAKLGEGGMGVVYRAWDRSLAKEVALERVRHKLDAVRARQLKSEFRARSALQHRNLVQLYELVIDGEDCFLTMELVAGTDLGSWVRGGLGGGLPEELPVTAQTLADLPNARAVSRQEASARVGSEPRSSGRSGSGSRVVAPLDEAGVARLRAAITELCTGLAVLHEAGIVHRDVTPANVRVTPGGRVVLLDFGLAARSADECAGSGIIIAGTPRYMAPEQVRAEATAPPADVYAMGGIIYELIASRSAYAGTVRSMQVAKAAGEPPLPIPSGSPDDELAALAMEMLEPEPTARPAARAVLRRLAGEASVVAPTFGLPARGNFVGREEDVAAIEEALRRVRSEQRPRAMIIEGPSGIGKTMLLKHALADLGTTLVLAARCNPQETIPFKALDAAVDMLAAHAARLADLGPFPPALAHAAVRLFPVLQSVTELGKYPPPETSPEPSDLRAQGFEALRDLFGRLSVRGPVVLWIDDVQWDDEDSAALLEALLRGRGAPPLLLILSRRSESRTSAIAERLFKSREVVPVERRTIGPLGEGDVEGLAAAFLGPGDARIAGVVAQSEGNPFLACELARYLSTDSRGSLRAGTPEVQWLVEARLRDLDPAERALLVATAMAVRPLTIRCALAASHLARDAHTSALALRDALLVRLGASASGETIAPYHDKIAEATQQLLSAEERRSVHRALAEALEQYEPGDADALCVHWEGAGELPRASASAYRAAENASVALAFGRAAELYEKAISLGYDGVERALLLERTAVAHANHGEGPLAAGRFLDASLELGDDATSARVRTLKRLAAEQFVKSGYMRRGWEVMRSVLDAAQIPQPKSATQATLVSLGRRLRFLARRIDIDSIGDRQIPDGERPRLELLWTASTSMSMVNVTLSDAFSTLHMQRILDVGDASSIARALAYEVALEAHVGGPLFDWHAERLLRLAIRLVDRTGDPYDRAWLQLGIANQAYCAGHFREAIAACRKSEQILREQCSGVAWEITTVAAFLLTSLAMVGDLPALREATERFAREAEARGNLYGIAESYSGECVLGWWSIGSGDDALARASEAVARQGADAHGWPEKNYRRGQLTELMATVHLRLLAADPWPAWTMMIAHWDGLKSALIPSLQFYRSWLRHGRARCALASAETLGKKEARAGWTREALLADVRRTLREMKKDKRSFAGPWAALIEAGLAEAEGHRPHAVASLEVAVAGFERADMALYREAARLRLAALTGSTTLRAEAESWMRGQGVPDPEALARALVPGFGGL